MTILLSMNGRMARTAQRLEIIQSVVSMFFWRGDAVPVNMMNVQIILCAAASAGVIVTLQGLHAVAAEAVVVFCLLAILFNLVGVFVRPFSYPGDVRIVATRFAFALRSSRVFKRRPTIFARQHVSFARRANGISLSSAVFSTLDAMVFFFTSIARFLRRSCRDVAFATNRALTLRDPAFGLSVRSKSARLASFCVWACSCYFRAAVRAIYDAVGLHMSGSRMMPNKYSGGAV